MARRATRGPHPSLAIFVRRPVFASAPAADYSGSALLYCKTVFRSAYAIVVIIVLTVLCGIPAALLSLVNPRGDWVVRIGRVWARGIANAAGVSIEARGVEHLPQGHPYILISNHQSHFDLIAFILTFPRSFRVVAKRLLFYIPIFGWCLWAAGMIPIDRSRRQSAIKSLERAAERVRAGEPILFYPEGTRSPDGDLLPFKKGAFVIALKSGVPIVPVSVAGSRAILGKGSIRIRPGRIAITYGPEIELKSYTLDEKELLIERVRQAVIEGLKEVNPARTAAHDAGRARRAETAPR